MKKKDQVSTSWNQKVQIGFQQRLFFFKKLIQKIRSTGWAATDLAFF